jgi:hypothetical protein
MESIGKIAKFEQRKAAKPKTNPHLHSPAHLLADELSVKLNDRKHFALYLGMAKKFDHQFLRKILGEVLEGREVQTPGRLFTFLVKKRNDEMKQELGSMN